MRNRTMAVALAIVIAAAIAACGGSTGTNTSATGPIKLGMILKFPVDFFFTIRDAGQKYVAGQSGVTLQVGLGHAATDDQGEIDLIQSMVTQGVKGIAITPTSAAVIPALDAAVAKGVKVVLIDNDLPDWNKKSALVATDNLKGGQLAGQYLAQHLKSGATVIVLQGRVGVPSLDDRVNGMKQALGSGIQVVGMAPTDCDQNKGVSAAADLLTAHPNADALYAACGPPALGAIQSIDKAGKTGKITLVGYDALPDEVKMIASGKETASVAQFPAKMGELGVATLLKAVQGQTVDARVDTGTAVVTKDNASQFGG